MGNIAGFVPSSDLPSLGNGRGQHDVPSLDAIVKGLDAIAHALGVAEGQEEHITVVVAGLEDQGEEAGDDDEDDDEADDLDVFEVHFVRQWLLRLSGMCWNEGSSCEKMEHALSKASRLIAVLSGQCASGTMHKCYHFSSGGDRGGSAEVFRGGDATQAHTSVHIGETALVEDALGGRTWFAAPLLADYVAKQLGGSSPSSALSALELGAGTGLAGLTLSACLAQHGINARVDLSDFNADVLANLRRNVGRNGWSGSGGEKQVTGSKSKGAIDVQVHKLLWGQHVMLNDHKAASGTLLDTYNCILAADCVYEAQHAALLRQTAERFLTRQYALDVDDVGDRCSMHGKMLMMSPQRLHHDKELASIEAHFPAIQSIMSSAANTDKSASLQLCVTSHDIFQVQRGDNFGPPRLLSKAKRSVQQSASEHLAGRTSCIKARQVLADCRPRVSADTIDDPLPSADGLYYRLYTIEWVRLGPRTRVDVEHVKIDESHTEINL